MKREQVDLAPIRQFIAGGALPILGDDPRSMDGRKVFSAALLQMDGQAPSGYIYVVLLGEAHDALEARVAASSVLRNTLWSMALVALLGLVAGLMAFGLITRPLRRLTDAMRRFDADGEPDTQPLVPRSSSAGQRDEIAVLEATFAADGQSHRRSVARAAAAGPATPRTDCQYLARSAHAADVAARLPRNTIVESGLAQ